MVTRIIEQEGIVTMWRVDFSVRRGLSILQKGANNFARARGSKPPISRKGYK
jgi:hypothetical protein